MSGPTPPAVPTPRSLHYADFYGLRADPARTTDIVLVHGNCQAEALRVLLDRPDAPTVRIPPVFELTDSDIPFLYALLARTSVLVTHPVRNDYAGLPVGSAQLAAALRPTAQVIRVPIVRWTGLHPYAAIIRDPMDPSRPPPVVPYHDLRTVAAAAGRPIRVPAGTGVLRAIADGSSDELRRRESGDCDLRISDLLQRPEPGDMLTLNHPGNRILVALATRVRAAMGTSEPVVDPGRVLLGEVVAPVPTDALRSLGLLGRGPASADSWQVRGQTIPDAVVVREQTAWYLANPQVLEEGLRRHGRTLALLGAA